MGDFENALHRGRTEACKKMDRNKNRRCRNQQCIQAHLTSVDLWEGKLKNWKCSRVTVKTIAGVINEVFFFCFLFCRGSFIKTWTVHWDCQPFPLPLHQEQRWISPRAVCTLWSKNKGFCVYVCVCAHYCISNRYLISYLTLWWRKRAFVGLFFFLTCSRTNCSSHSQWTLLWCHFDVAWLMTHLNMIHSASGRCRHRGACMWCWWRWWWCMLCTFVHAAAWTRVFLCQRGQTDRSGEGFLWFSSGVHPRGGGVWRGRESRAGRWWSRSTVGWLWGRQWQRWGNEVICDNKHRLKKENPRISLSPTTEQTIDLSQGVKVIKTSKEVKTS